MGDAIILDMIPFAMNLDQLENRLHIEPSSDNAIEFEVLVQEAQRVARPKALYRLAFVTSRDEESVTIEGVRFVSRVLSVNLQNAHRVFAYMATCGTELDDWAHDKDDPLQQFWAEAIKESALRAAIKAMNEDLEKRYKPGKTSTMNPGSLLDWPLKQQRPLFALLGDPQAAIGVRLTPSCLMVPNKSVSGIRFPTEESFESCQLCPAVNCPGRRAPYDPDLYDKKYRP